MLSQAMIKHPTSMQARSLTGPIEMFGAIMPSARNSEIYGVNERAKYLYKVLKGSVRTCKVAEDGRRQISAFYLPGDVFGFEAGDEHTLSAEAIVDCQLLVIRRTSLATLATRDSSVARQLWAMTAAELQRTQDHVMLLIKNAQERVAWFLLEMSMRSSSSDDEINLPMSRQDIADYLGLTIETVSRSLTKLENVAAISLPSARHVVLRNRKALIGPNS